MKRGCLSTGSLATVYSTQFEGLWYPRRDSKDIWLICGTHVLWCCCCCCCCWRDQKLCLKSDYILIFCNLNVIFWIQVFFSNYSTLYFINIFGYFTSIKGVSEVVSLLFIHNTLVMGITVYIITDTKCSQQYYNITYCLFGGSSSAILIALFMLV